MVYAGIARLCLALTKGEGPLRESGRYTLAELGLAILLVAVLLLTDRERVDWLARKVREFVDWLASE